MNQAEPSDGVEVMRMRQSILPRLFYVLCLSFFVMMCGRIGLRVIFASGLWTPIIRVQPVVYDFGAVDADTTLEAQLQIHNAGQRSLKIHDIRIGCPSCTRILDDITRDLPGQSQDTLTLEFRSPSTAGKVIRTVAVHSNDPVQAVVVVKLIADVRDKSLEGDGPAD